MFTVFYDMQHDTLSLCIVYSTCVQKVAGSHWSTARNRNGKLKKKLKQKPISIKVRKHKTVPESAKEKSSGVDEL